MCRRLFGPVDSEQLRRDCDALMAGCLQEARERWNFDFVTETPLEGNFVWERVRGLGLPKIYLSPGSRGRDDLGGDKRPSTSSALLQGPAPEDHVALSLSCTLVSHAPERPEDSPGGPGTSQGRKRKQTSLTGKDRRKEGRILPAGGLEKAGHLPSEHRLCREHPSPSPAPSHSLGEGPGA